MIRKNLPPEGGRTETEPSAKRRFWLPVLKLAGSYAAASAFFAARAAPS